MIKVDIYIPSGEDEKKALERTTHLAVSAHQDDIEFMAYDGILKCFMQDDKYFTAVVATNGSGSPRSGLYGDYSDEHMMSVRKQEQKKAAVVGDYSAQVFMDIPSATIKNPDDRTAIEDLKKVIEATQPKVIYTHNPADKHDTHVAVVLRLITALRELNYKPDEFYGCEVWRGLDWMCDNEKIAFDVSSRPNLEAALLGVFDSQIAGGKRYDLAVTGRRLANATFSESHGVDNAEKIIYAVDLLPVLNGESTDEYIAGYIDRFKNDVKEKIKKLQ